MPSLTMSYSKYQNCRRAKGAMYVVDILFVCSGCLKVVYPITINVSWMRGCFKAKNCENWVGVIHAIDSPFLVELGAILKNDVWQWLFSEPNSTFEREVHIYNSQSNLGTQFHFKTVKWNSYLFSIFLISWKTL